MSDILTLLNEAAVNLLENGITESRREAVSLLMFAITKEKPFIIAHPEFEPGSDEVKLFRESLLRRAAGEPLQYITGKQEFYGLEFEVNENVLIPRPETEIIVENAVSLLSDSDKSRFCEIGTGSGCISVSILHEVVRATAVGADISQKALEISQRNAVKHQVSDRLVLLNSDIFQNVPREKFVLIVSNPPYISSSDIPHLQREVKDFEPINALTDGKNGLSIIKKLISESPGFLLSGGFLLIEIGFGQADEVEMMFSADIWRSVEILPDLQGIPRTVKAQLL